MKTETMCIEMLHKASTKPKHRILVATPYETQVRLIFTRLTEIIHDSPLINEHVVKNTKNPYWIELDNEAIIIGFTTGAASGSNAASLRGQRADSIYLDEMDYMGAGDFDVISAIAGERPDISIFASSTPSGARSKFWEICTKREIGYTEHYHPSMHNPNWGPEMEAEFRSSMSEQQYTHEILAEFGTQDVGVFNKEKLDEASQVLDYAYNPLDYYQDNNCKTKGTYPQMLLYDKQNKAPFNPWRMVGVDWDQ